MTKRLAVIGLVALLTLVGRQANASPVLGSELFYTGGTVTITTLPVTSGFTSQLGLYDSSFALLTALTFDEPPGVVVTFDPSTYGFVPGDELIFGINVLDTGDTFFMGPATRNPDGELHAGVDSLGGGQFVVGFEDLLGGGDRDYDDNRFLFEGGILAVPEPATLSLLVLGAIPVIRRRMKK